MLTEDTAHPARLVEWGEAPEIYVSGIGAISETDGNIRFTLFAWVSPPDEPFAEKRVRCHIIMAAAAVETAMRETQAFFANATKMLLS